MRAALLFVLLSSAPAFASGDKVVAGTEVLEASAQAQPQEEKKICKRIDASESRTAAKRVCLTASEWKKRQQADAL